MSWIETITDNLIITTGDGKRYTPEWMDASKSHEYNIAEFNFANIPGTMVDRRLPLGRKYNLRIFFQGDNHLDTSEAFLTSADDPRPWVISHPLYPGAITVQPTSLQVDRTKLNVTEISGIVLETITTDNPKTNVVPADKIAADKATLDDTNSTAFANEITMDSATKNTITANNTAYQAEAAKQVTDNTESENLLNLYNDAQSAIIDATNEPEIAMQKTQAFINYPPSLLSNSVNTRLKLLSNQYATLNASVANIITKEAKVVYQTTGTTLISNMAIVASTPQAGNYGNRNQVLSAINTLLNAYNAFLQYLDSLQSANGGAPGNYIPTASVLTALNDLMNYTISNLFIIALNSKQERIIYLEDDSNLIELTHRFYGLDNADVNIDYFIATNEIGLNEMLGLAKGRRIVYYV